MKTSYLLLLFIISTELSGGSTSGLERKLYRKKRYLIFPPGSITVFTMAYSSAYVWNLYTPTWNHITELDLGFFLPNSTEALFFGRRRKVKEMNKLHRMQRRDLYFNIESMLYMYGIDGHSCVSRAICEAREHLTTGNSFLEDILLTMFTVPQGTDDELDSYEGAISGLACKVLISQCPFSLIKHLLEEQVIDY